VEIETLQNCSEELPDKLIRLVSSKSSKRFETAKINLEIKECLSLISCDVIKGWSKEQIAKTYFALITLRVMRIKVSPKIIRLICHEPNIEKEPIAHQWWVKAYSLVGIKL